MIRNISIHHAVASLLADTPSPACEEIPLSEANGRVLSAGLTAKADLPPFHRSAYDGFAFRSDETAGASDKSPSVFRITGTVAAGDVYPKTLEEGCCVRIMTGAPLPEGADCVLNFERVRQVRNEVYLTQSLCHGQNVDWKGSETSAGTPLLPTGEYLTPAHLGVLASQGYDKISVCRKPRASVLSTGSELLSPGQSLTPGKIYDSNLTVFRALLEQEGCRVTQYRHVSDEEGTIRSTLQALAQDLDLIITTGGASVGDKDYISRVLEQAGATILFSHIRMKPGSCCYGAKLGSCIVISLSGNPGAALTSWFLIALPVVRKLAGRQNFHLQEMVLPLADTVYKTCPYPRILKGHLETEGGMTRFVAHEGQKNSMQTSFLHMDALAELPPTDAPLPAGTQVSVFLP